MMERINQMINRTMIKEAGSLALSGFCTGLITGLAILAYVLAAGVLAGV